jgi:type II secretory pathway component PulF
VNVWESFVIAARTSASAKIVKSTPHAVASLQSGQRLAEVIAESNAFPKETVRAIRISEESGDMDKELPRLAREFEASALDRLERWSEWLPKIIYTLVVIYMGYQIVTAYQRIITATTQLPGDL